MLNWFKAFAIAALLALPGLAAAQGAQVAFGNMQQNSNLPVEVTADNLDVDQEDGTAIFTGNVKIGQGDMRLSAPRVLVVYKEDQSGIKTLQATGGVTLVSGQDAAEAARAEAERISSSATGDLARLREQSARGTVQSNPAFVADARPRPDGVASHLPHAGGAGRGAVGRGRRCARRGGSSQTAAARRGPPVDGRRGRGAAQGHRDDGQPG